MVSFTKFPMEPESQITRTALAQVYSFRQERELFRFEAKTAMALNPNAPAPSAFWAGCWRCMGNGNGDWLSWLKPGN